MKTLQRTCAIFAGILILLLGQSRAEPPSIILSPGTEASAAPVISEDQRIFKVQIGNFGTYEEAQKVKEALAPEFRGLFVARHGGTFRIQVAAFSRQEKAKELHQKLQNMGFKVYIETQ